MFNRILLILLCTLSLGWILYVGYDVFYKTDRLNPELIFSKDDQELLIINRTDEFYTTDIPFVLHPEITEIAHKFIETPRNERIFLSKERPIMVIESPNYWNKNGVIKYLERKGITYQEKDNIIYVGDYQIRFKYHFLLVAKKDFKKNDADFALPSWDKKATAVIIHHVNENPYLTEIYRQETGQITYQTTFDNRLKSEKTDDKNVFAPYLPADITSYHFYEKNYALENNALPVESPMNEWIQYGFVVFDYQGNSVIISDSKTGEDPLNSLNTKYGKDTLTFKENTLISNVKLTESFPSNTLKGFYLTRVGDKVIFSEDLNLNKKILADYELGNTLLLDIEKSEWIYGKLPYKVSERYISSTNYYAVSSYAHISTKYVVQSSSNGKSSTMEQINSTSSKHFIVPINGTVKQAIGKGNQQYFITSSNQLFAINNGKTVWTTTLSGTIIGDVKLVDYEGTGKVHLLFNTAKKIYLLNEQGDNLLENQFTPKQEFMNEVNLYSWKNQYNLIYIDEAGKAKNSTIAKGKINTITIDAGSTIKKIEVFAQNGRVIGAINGDKATETLDLDKFKAVKKHPVITPDAIRYKASGLCYYVYYQGGQVVKADYSSKKSILGSYKSTRLLKNSIIDNKNYISFISSNTLYIYNESGEMMKKTALPNGDIQDYDIHFLHNKLYIALLDGLENKIIITSEDGTILRKDLEGKNFVFLSNSKNQLNILSEGNGYAVQYYQVLQKK